MNIKRLSIVGMSIVMLGLTQTASAGEFFRAGKITRVITASNNFGNCMVLLDSSISNGCPSSGWVSLDCKGVYFPTVIGKRKYAAALTAFTLKSKVLLKVDNTKKHDGYCVASRIDIF